MLIETTLGLMDTDEFEEHKGVSDDDEWRRVSSASSGTTACWFAATRRVEIPADVRRSRCFG